MADLERIVASMAATAEQAGVQIVTGDTKVVDRGSADKLFINTAGIGVMLLALVKTGDRIRIDLGERSANILISDEDLAARKADIAAQLADTHTPGLGRKRLQS